MARRIIWSRRAQNDRFSILDYWTNKTKSNTYSKRLNLLFISSVEFAAKHPYASRLTDRKNIRMKFASHFAIIFEFSESEIHVLAIFDTRQNPNKLKRVIS